MRFYPLTSAYKKFPYELQSARPFNVLDAIIADPDQTL